MSLYKIVHATIGYSTVGDHQQMMYDDLAEKVSALIVEGWKCEGGLVVAENAGEIYRIIQGMSRSIKSADSLIS